MTRIGFNALAKGLKNSTAGIDGIAHALMVQNVACELAQLFPRFDADKFAEACRPDVTPIESPSSSHIDMREIASGKDW